MPSTIQKFFYSCSLGDLNAVKKILDKDASLANCVDHDGLTPLYIASEIGSSNIVKLLISYGSDVNVTFGDKNISPLFCACVNGHLAVVELLLGCDDIDVNLATSDGSTPFCAVCANGYPAIAELLLTHPKIDTNPETTSGARPFWLACERGHVAIIKILLDKGTNVNEANEKGFTPLITACSGGYVDVVQLLLDSGAEINRASRVNNENVTPLFNACVRGYSDIVKLLLERKADIDQTYSSDLTHLCAAVSSGHKDIVKLLLDYGADIHQGCKNGATPLHFACLKGHHNIVKLLLDEGSHVNVVCSYHGTPLHIACAEGHGKIAELLIVKGADVNQVIESGSTPLFVACTHGWIDVARILLDKGAHINQGCLSGLTPLQTACSSGHQAIVELLLDRGADVNQSSHSSLTPIYLAVSYGHEAIVKLLLSSIHIDVNISVGDDEIQPFHLACEMMNTKIIRHLLFKTRLNEGNSALNSKFLSCVRVSGEKSRSKEDRCILSLVAFEYALKLPKDRVFSKVESDVIQQGKSYKLTMADRLLSRYHEISDDEKQWANDTFISLYQESSVRYPRQLFMAFWYSNPTRLCELLLEQTILLSKITLTSLSLKFNYTSELIGSDAMSQRKLIFWMFFVNDLDSACYLDLSAELKKSNYQFNADNLSNVFYTYFKLDGDKPEMLGRMASQLFSTLDSWSSFSYDYWLKVLRKSRVFSLDVKEIQSDLESLSTYPKLNKVIKHLEIYNLYLKYASSQPESTLTAPLFELCLGVSPVLFSDSIICNVRLLLDNSINLFQSVLSFWKFKLYQDLYRKLISSSCLTEITLACVLANKAFARSEAIQCKRHKDRERAATIIAHRFKNCWDDNTQKGKLLAWVETAVLIRMDGKKIIFCLSDDLVSSLKQSVEQEGHADLDGFLDRVFQDQFESIVCCFQAPRLNLWFSMIDRLSCLWPKLDRGSQHTLTEAFIQTQMATVLCGNKPFSYQSLKEIASEYQKSGLELKQMYTIDRLIAERNSRRLRDNQLRKVFQRYRQPSLFSHWNKLRENMKSSDEAKPFMC